MISGKSRGERNQRAGDDDDQPTRPVECYGRRRLLPRFVIHSSKIGSFRLRNTWTDPEVHVRATPSRPALERPVTRGRCCYSSTASRGDHGGGWEPSELSRVVVIDMFSFGAVLSVPFLEWEQKSVLLRWPLPSSSRVIFVADIDILLPPADSTTVATVAATVEIARALPVAVVGIFGFESFSQCPSRNRSRVSPL